ncbi:MAG: ketoacyl-ACP synthase III [Mangrovibacterium sp.]
MIKTKAYIKAISYYLPEKVLTNEELVREFSEWTVEKVANKVGIDSRHIAAKDETSGDMAERAAQNLFEEWNVKPQSVDFVLLCTQSPDYFLPTTACVLQHRLGISTDSGALDFNLGCSGFVYGLALAKGLVLSSVAKNVLLLTSETYSKHIHPQDKGNRTIFGDAATASLISSDGFAEIGEFSLGTDGRGAENLIVKNRRHEAPGNFK